MSGSEVNPNLKSHIPITYYNSYSGSVAARVPREVGFLRTRPAQVCSNHHVKITGRAQGLV